MKAQFKIDFETFMQTHQTKHPMYFEGQTYKNNKDLMYITYMPVSVKRPAVDCEQHEVYIRFYLFSKNLLNCDKMIDDLSALLSERNIDNMEFRTMETFQRGNKHGDTMETIADIKFFHWSNPAAQVDTLS